ncbi:MAG: metallophosphoesterase [Anaerovorax sp.]
MLTKFGQYITGKKFVPAFFLLLIAACYFVYKEICGFVFRTIGIRPGWWVLALLLGMFLLTLVMRNSRNFTPMRKFLIVFAHSYVAYFLYFALFLLAGKLLSFLLNLIWHSVQWDSLFFLIALAGSAVVFCYGTWNARRIQTITYPITLGDNGKPYRMVLLSDIHLGSCIGAGYISRMVESVNALQPDMVVISGDTFNGRSTKECTNIKGLEALFRQLNAKDGVIAVTGNHDPEPSDASFLTFLERSGITLLSDQTMELAYFSIVGRNDVSLEHSSFGRKTLDEMLTKLNPTKPCIVLDHNPRGADEAATRNIALILCGHTHRGQFFPMDLVTKAVYGKERFWGHWKIDGMHIVTSAGVGYFQMPLRVNTKNEIVSLELTF